MGRRGLRPLRTESFDRRGNAWSKRMGITVISRLHASILLLTVFLAHAQRTSNTERSTTVSHATMRSILQGMRIEFIENPSDESATLDFQLNGRKVTLLNHVKAMHMSACLDGIIIGEPLDAPDHVQILLKMNRWNQEHFSTRAYRDEHGCASLGADLDFAGGMTRAMIEGYIRQFSTAVTVFGRLMVELTPGPNAPASTPAAGVQPAVDRPASPVATMAWSQSRADTSSAPPSPSAAGSVPGLLRISSNISLRYDADKWKQTPSRDVGQFALTDSSADGHALIIGEGVAVPLDSVVDVALANAQFADPSAKVVFRHKRRVNGVDLWFLKIEAEMNAVPMVYLGCYYAGQSSTVQVVTYTTKALLPKFENDFMELLNGLTISAF
jgi:putative sensory transduction regulator